MIEMYGVTHRLDKKVKDLTWMLVFHKALDQLTKANSVCWYGYVLRLENGHELKTLEFETDG